jgi:hypothetical protein
MVLAAGCGREEIRVYSVPKEDPWKLPAGWKPREAGQMRAAQFVIPAQGTIETDVSLIPIKGQMARPETIPDILNIWRQQMELEPIEPGGLAKLGQKVPVGRSEGDLYEMVSTGPVLENKSRQRTLVAAVNTDGTLWFIKITGEENAVTQEKSGFLAFLKSLNLDAMPSPAPGTGRPAGAGAREARTSEASAKPQWTIPPGWQETAPSQMLLAKFIAGQQGSKAEVTVSAFPGGAGGMLANINRWRDQLQLKPVEESGLDQLLGSLDLPSGKAILVDMNGTDAKSGKPARIIGAIQERDGLTWFYKMTGSEEAAAREKESFINFLKTVKYPNG